MHSRQSVHLAFDLYITFKFKCLVYHYTHGLRSFAAAISLCLKHRKMVYNSQRYQLISAINTSGLQFNEWYYAYRRASIYLLFVHL